MKDCQRGILLPIPPLARYLTFSVRPGADPRGSLRALRDVADGERVVVGIGRSLALAIGRNVEGLRTFPQHAGAGFDVPSTPSAHVKRTAQESFEPAAFLVRRSMPQECVGLSPDTLLTQNRPQPNATIGFEIHEFGPARGPIDGQNRS